MLSSAKAALAAFPLIFGVAVWLQGNHDKYNLFFPARSTTHPNATNPFAEDLRRQTSIMDGLSIEEAPIRKLDASIDEPDVLNVHLVPHTHDDVGWLKTVEQYYYGLNMTIQQACVRDILDSMVVSLLKNPSRTFTYVEVKFFSMWWSEQSKEVKASVHYLIANDQLFFVNGGWCMHDEATTHFMGMIDQTTLGHQFLKQELGVVPRVGWQLDPFGHSATQASLLTANAGMDALYFGRVDYQDLKIRHETRECEGLWSASKAEGSDNTIFYGLTGEYNGQYECPKGFCFDVTCHDRPLLDMNRTELIKKVIDFVKLLKVQSDRTKGNHIMITQGGDFTYRFAEAFFVNNDLLMQSLHTFQQLGLINITSLLGPTFRRVNMFYSSPDYYTEMKHKETMFQEGAGASPETDNHRSVEDPRHLLKSDAAGTIEWTVKNDDFFPYADCPHCYWTGYFTSRTGFKKLERVSSAFLLAAKQIEAFPDNSSTTGKLPESDKPLFDLEDASGVAQHHDGVSGTAKQHVANDYSKRIQAGMNKAARYVEQKLKRLLVHDSNASTVLENLGYCQFLNETICDVSQEATKGDISTMHIIVYNGLGSSRSEIVRLPVSSDSTFIVSRVGKYSAETVSTSVIRSSPSPFWAPVSASARYVLMFDTGPLAPIGATVFRITHELSGTDTANQAFPERHHNQQFLGSATVARSLQLQKGRGGDPDAITVSSDYLTVRFDRATGAMISIATNHTTLNVTQTWGYYTSFDKTLDSAASNSAEPVQNSGAYIFRTSTPDQVLHPVPYNKGKIVHTSVGTEIHAVFSEPWIKQVTRVLKGLPYVEVEYSIGPIPVEDGRGKEIVTKFSTPISSSSAYFTDSNGREFLERRRNYRPSWNLTVNEPIAGNYYPINAALYIEDNTSSFAVLTDRTQAGASLSDGTIEFMAQRRILADDNRGVAEPMNETNGGVTPYPPYGKAERWGEGVVIRGTYRIMIGNGNTGASIARSEMDRAFAPPLVFVASSPSTSNASDGIRGSLSVLQKALPPNIMLVTFQRFGGTDSNQYLIRLGHQYGKDEDRELSQPVAVDLASLLVGFEVASVEEMTLTGNQKLSDWQKTRLRWVGSNPHTNSPMVSKTNTTVTLQPMDVRTIVVTMGNLTLTNV